MDSQMHKISILCTISIALQRFQKVIFPITGTFLDEKNINSLISVFNKVSDH